MDPHVVFDCQKVLPNKFALTLAAAARSRALAHGAEPRLDADERSVSELALHEIAAGVFREDELARFLPGSGGRRSLPPSEPASRLRDGASESAAAAPVSRPRETVH
jgi:DNA-directed RNA polymerase subunit omega